MFGSSLGNVLLFDNVQRVEDRHRLGLDINEGEAGLGQQRRHWTTLRADRLLQVLSILRFIGRFGRSLQ